MARILAVMLSLVSPFPTGPARDLVLVLTREGDVIRFTTVGALPRCVGILHLDAKGTVFLA